MADHCKLLRSFKISNAKMLRVNSEKIAFKQAYSCDYCDHVIFKRVRKWEQLKTAITAMVNCVKPAKNDDVPKLLGEIDVNKDVRGFYEDFMDLSGFFGIIKCNFVDLSGFFAIKLNKISLPLKQLMNLIFF